MTMQGTHRAQPGLRPRAWRSASALTAVRQLNERVLEVFTKLAAEAPLGTTLQVVERHRDLLLELDASTRRRAAQVPVLLLDAQFQSQDWSRSAGSAQRTRMNGAAATDAFQPECAVELLRETLTLAWITARGDRYAARILFGMTPGVEKEIAALTAPMIDRIASCKSCDLRPRWEAHPWYWERLLLAAQASDDDMLRGIHLYSLQLLGGELIQHSS